VLLKFRVDLVLMTSRWPWQPSKYMTLKLTNCFDGDHKSANKELQMSHHYSKLQSKHESSKYVRVVQNSFMISGPFGEHLCMVFEPLREPLWLLGRHLGTVGLSLPILKAFLKLVLRGLDFLRSECHIIHTSKLLTLTFLTRRTADCGV
jgi:serine/threonine-protein kinase SRPK3